jgi:pimeloyl-ACP methyl ester carboxylesterase
MAYWGSMAYWGIESIAKRFRGQLGRRLLLAARLGLSTALTTTGNALGAERLEFFIRPYEATIWVEDLETLAKAGIVTERFRDFDNVGVLGHSLGGFTVLAAAVAELNFSSSWNRQHILPFGRAT